MMFSDLLTGAMRDDVGDSELSDIHSEQQENIDLFQDLRQVQTSSRPFDFLPASRGIRRATPGLGSGSSTSIPISLARHAVYSLKSTTHYFRMMFTRSTSLARKPKLKTGPPSGPVFL